MPLCWIAYSALLIATGLAQAQPQPARPASTAEDSLKTFLRDYVKDHHSDDDKTTRYFDVFVDLNNDGKKEVIVYLMDGGWCGSGGCTMLVLAPEASSFKVITRVTISRPPIRVLSSISHGWHNISVRVAGGGIEPAYEAELRFDGKTYPGNPSVPPARQLIGKMAGKVVIPSMQGGTPLFP